MRGEGRGHEPLFGLLTVVPTEASRLYPPPLYHCTGRLQSSIPNTGTLRGFSQSLCHKVSGWTFFLMSFLANRPAMSAAMHSTASGPTRAAETPEPIAGGRAYVLSLQALLPTCGNAAEPQVSWSRPLPTPCRAREVPTAIPSSCEPVAAAPMVHTPCQPSLASSCLPLTDPADVAAGPCRGLARPIGRWECGLTAASFSAEAAAVLGEDMDKVLSFGAVPLGFTPRQLHALFRPAFHSVSLRGCLGHLSGPLAPLGERLSLLMQGTAEDLPGGFVCYTDGSFVPGATLRDQRAGWSCIFFHCERQTCDVITGQLPDWCQAESGLSAFKAALWLLLFGLVSRPRVEPTSVSFQTVRPPWL